jgi:hypothetical protein
MRAWLAPVAEHHRGAELTFESLVAAWLRSHSIAPDPGLTDVARKQIEDGYAFPKAIGAAVREAEARPPAGAAPRRAGVPTTAPAGGSSSPARALPSDEVVAESLHFGEVAEHLQPSGHWAVSSEPSTGGLAQLVHKPKRYGEGDIDGSGVLNLLGRSKYDQVEVLVRETAQNSWDARDKTGRGVQFGLHLRRLTAQQRQVLRQQVFPELPPAQSLGIAREMAKPEDIWVLEITDRGTVGLGGPVRNDIVVPPDVTTNFADFVLTLGAPRDQEFGGGTYGYGKTIAYTSSHSGVVLISSRTLDHGLEHRLIGSGIGQHYEHGSYRYTGRHWWGVVTEDDRVEPLTGEPAEKLHDAVFARSFEEGERGTSLLIVSPDFGEDSAHQYAQRLVDAALTNLWPKLVRDPRATPFELRVFLDGTELPVPNPAAHPVLQHYVSSLHAVRSKQGGSPYSLGPMTEVHEVRGPYSSEVVGHVAFTSYLSLPGMASSDGGDLNLGDSTCWMRKAELVVRYKKGSAKATGDVAWAGVFKPLDVVDDAFSKSEPPTHDDWLPASVNDKKLKSIVNVALKNVDTAVGQYVTPPTVAAGPVTGPSVTALADALAGLVAGVTSNRVTSESSGGREGSKSSSRKLRLSVVDWEASEVFDDGGREWRLLVQCEGEGPETTFVPVVSICQIGNDDSDEEAAYVCGWDSGPDVPEFMTEPEFPLLPATFRSGEQLWLRLAGDADLALSVKFDEVKT